MLTVINGDCRERLRELADESVHCCVTSPPYWGLRDYGTAKWEGGDAECDHSPEKRGSRFATPVSTKQASNNGSGSASRRDCDCGARRIDSQLGLESSPEEYVAQMVAVFREVRRVLRSDGTCWVNLGDSYANTGGMTGGTNSKENGKRAERMFSGAYRPLSGDLKQKDLVGIPWAVAFALRADGWYLRSEIIWHKPNPMPESVTDRPTKAHEQVFLLAKSSRYFYDAEAIREPHLDSSLERYQNGFNREKKSGTGLVMADAYESVYGNPAGRNRRTVWTIATAPYSDAHFATFPPKLVEPCVLAGTSARGCCAECGAPWERVVATTRTFESGSGRSGNGISGKQPPVQGAGYGDVRLGPTISTETTGWQPTCTHLDAEVEPCTVLDPFAGSGTVGQVALEAGRRAILIELNAKYCEMIAKRNQVTYGLPGLA